MTSEGMVKENVQISYINWHFCLLFSMAVLKGEIGICTLHPLVVRGCWLYSRLLGKVRSEDTSVKWSQTSMSTEVFWPPMLIRGMLLETCDIQHDL